MTTPLAIATRVTRVDIDNNASPPQFAAVLLDRLTRLRVVTASQAHQLTPTLARRTLRNAYHRLSRLVAQGWLAMDAVAPHRGAAAPHYYRPSYKALRHLGLEKKLGLIQRPAQHVLDYLLFRAEIYARAEQGGWYIGSPIFLQSEKHSVVLARFCEYLKRRALERYKAAQANAASSAILLQLRAEIERLPLFLPKELTFEFLYQVDSKTAQTTSVVLLLIDDVRRSIKSQVEALPLAAKQNCEIVIRDCESVWNPDEGAHAFVGRRLIDLRQAVTSRFGDELQESPLVLPSVWGRIARPANREVHAAFHSQPKELP